MTYQPQKDFGTPASKASDIVTLSIDGRDVSVPVGTSVMRAAAEIDNIIPKLCATDNVKSFGSCRLCLIEIEGRKGTPASCTTPAEDGMVVKTQTPHLQRLRKGVMELYISDHPLDCLTCSANNDCELQDQAANVGLRDVRYGYEGANHLGEAKDTSNPYFDFDPSKCIACSRCVRACDEVQGTFALTMDGRGFASKISAGLPTDDFLSSECVSCGACVEACPTATLQEKAVAEIGKPDRTEITTCAYCGVGCTFRAEMRGEQLVRMVPWKDGKANRGHSCVKGRFAWGYANHQDRITKPMIRESIDQPWREVSWDEALGYAASEIKRIQSKYGRPGVGVNPLRGQNNVQGACDMGSFPHELSGYRHVSDATTRALFEEDWGVPIDSEPGLRIPNMLDAAVDGEFKALYVQGEDILQSDPNTKHVSAGLAAMECVIVHDLFLNETANYAHIFLPGSTFLEKNGTFTNAERRIQLVNKVMAPVNGMEDWEVTQALAHAMGLDWNYSHPSEIMDEIARLTPTFAGVSFARLKEAGSLQWPVNEAAPDGSPIMHVDGFVRGKGQFVVTDYVPTDEKTGPRFPLLLTTGRILSHYNVGAQTRRTANSAWHPEDLLEMHPTDAENRGLNDGDWTRLSSRSGETTLRLTVTERVAPGVVYTTFHHPATQANVVTTDFSDWATNCPEYKVTAVQVAASNGPTDWQEDYEELSEQSRRIETAEAAE